MTAASPVTGPAAVGNLTMTSANTSALSFSWHRSSGHVDIYDLSLFSVTEATANGRQEAQHQVGGVSMLEFDLLRKPNV